MPRQAGPILIALGAVAIVLGLLAWTGALRWFGNLPGDFRIERPNMRFYFPLVSMLLLSLLLTLILQIGRRLF